MTRPAQQMDSYKFRAGDVLQKRIGYQWSNFATLRTRIVAAAKTSIRTGLYAGVYGKFRIVRDGKQVAP